MIEVKIKLTEKDLRQRYAEHVNRKIQLISIADILKDETFKDDLIEDSLGAGGRKPEIPVKIEVQ